MGSPEKKKDQLKELDLDPSRIYDSHNPTFVEKIKAATGGYGADVVLNSLTGELLHASLGACADFGRFVELGKRDITDGGKLAMKQFGRNVTFSAFDLTELFSRSPRSTTRNGIGEQLVMFKL